MEVLLPQILVGHFALQHVLAGPQDRVPDCHRGFLGSTTSSEACVSSPEVDTLRARGRVCRFAVSALRNHLEPLRILPERRFPADSSLPGHVPAPRPGANGWESD